MKSSLRFITLLALACALRSFALAADVKAAADSPYAPLASFVGGLWSGDLTPEKDKPPMKIELRFAWAENKHGLRFDSSFVQGGKRAPYTSGMYGWNAATRKFVIFYTDSSGSLVEGPVAQEGDVFVHELTITDAAGKVELAQVRLHKVSADVFINTIYLQKNGSWEKFVEVRYVRQK